MPVEPAVIREPAKSWFSSSCVMMSIPDGTTYVLSVHLQFVAQISSVKITKNDKKGVWVLLFKACYLFSHELRFVINSCR